MEINLLLPNSDDNLTKKTSISTSISLWSSLSSTLSISPSDAIKVYSAVRKEASFQKYLVPPNQLDELIRSDSKNVKLFNTTHTFLKKHTLMISFSQNGDIQLEKLLPRNRNKKGQFTPLGLDNSVQKIQIKWIRKARGLIEKTIVESINEIEQTRLSFVKCTHYQSVIYQFSESEILKLVRLCKIHSDLDNDVLAHWLLSRTSHTKKEISDLMKRYDTKKLQQSSNVLASIRCESAQYFRFNHQEYSGLVMWGVANLYWLSCSKQALTHISKAVSDRKSVQLIKNAENQYVMDTHIFSLVSSTADIAEDELTIYSRKRE